MQLLPRSFGCEAPFDFGLGGISILFQLLNFSFERWLVSYAPIQALTTKDAQLYLRDIQPTPMLWRVMKLQLPQYPPRFFWRERLIQRCRSMCVQVIKHYSHSLGLWECFVNKPFHLPRKVLHRSLLGHRNVPPSSLRFAHHEQVAHASSLILIIKASDFPSTGGNWLPGFSDQLLARLIEADRGTHFVVIFGIQIKHIFHASNELGVDFADTPLLFQPRLEFVFLSTWRMVSRAIESVNFNSTTLSANSRNVQRARPSGGLLQATAIICASCLPVNLRACPRRGRSLRHPNPSSTKRLRVRSTVAKAVLRVLTMCSSVKPSAANSRMRARVTLREECWPRLTSRCKVSRSSSDKSTRYFFLGIDGQTPLHDLNQTIPVHRANPQNQTDAVLVGRPARWLNRPGRAPRCDGEVTKSSPVCLSWTIHLAKSLETCLMPALF